MRKEYLDGAAGAADVWAAASVLTSALSEEGELSLSEWHPSVSARAAANAASRKKPEAARGV